MKPSKPFSRLVLLLTAQLLASNAMAANAGRPSLPEQAQESAYRPQKVVYDVAVAARTGLAERLDRVSYVNTPPAKAGGFGLRLEAGSVGHPADCCRYTT